MIAIVLKEAQKLNMFPGNPRNAPPPKGQVYLHRADELKIRCLEKVLEKHGIKIEEIPTKCGPGVRLLKVTQTISASLREMKLGESKVF